MFVVITGGSGSGKSAYAEKTVQSFGAYRRIYVATMDCHDQESVKRIKRHREMRSGKGFETLECPEIWRRHPYRRNPWFSLNACQTWRPMKCSPRKEQESALWKPLWRG